MTEKQKKLEKKSKEKTQTNITLADYIGKKLVDISSENKTLTIKFSNGYNIIVSGNISISKEKASE